MTCDNCTHTGVCKWFPVQIAECSDFEEKRPHGEWDYLKEHITEMRDADGELNQKQTCQFILNLMGVIEREGEAE